MGAVSFRGDVVDRRIEHAARITVDDYVQYVKLDHRLSPKGEELEEMARDLGMTRAGLIELRKWAQQVTRTSKERLAREMTLLYTLNAKRDRILGAQYLIKAAAADVASVVPGDLLDLDEIYGGLMVQGVYVLVSDQTLARGLRKYRPEALLGGLIAERAAARA